MFVLTETAKAVQNSDSVILGAILGIIAALCIVMLVHAVVDGRR